MLAVQAITRCVMTVITIHAPDPLKKASLPMGFVLLSALNHVELNPMASG